MKKMAHAAVAILFLGLTASPARSATYYVDRNHASANDANNGTSESLPWKTISKANSTMQAGDTVLIKAGTYTTSSNTIQPSRSGAAGNPITYKNFGTDVVNIATGSSGYGVRLENRSHIVVEGINVTNTGRLLRISNGSNNTIARCVFNNSSRYYPDWAGSRVYNSSHHNWIHHCVFANYGYYDSEDHGCVLDVGLEESEDQTRCNLFENCEFYHGGHHVVGIYGMYNVFRNNYFHNEPWSMGTSSSDRGAVMYGNRNVGFSGLPGYGGRSLFENNRVGYSADPPDGWGSGGMGLNSSSNIVRFNYFYHNDIDGIGMSVTSTYTQSIHYNKIYNNTLFHNTNTPEEDRIVSAIGFSIYSGSWTIRNNAIKNNLLYKHRKPYGEYYYHGSHPANTSITRPTARASSCCRLGRTISLAIPRATLSFLTPARPSAIRWMRRCPTYASNRPAPPRIMERI